MPGPGWMRGRQIAVTGLLKQQHISDGDVGHIHVGQAVSGPVSEGDPHAVYVGFCVGLDRHFGKYAIAILKQMVGEERSASLVGSQVKVGVAVKVVVEEAGHQGGFTRYLESECGSNFSEGAVAVVQVKLVFNW